MFSRVSIIFDQSNGIFQVSPIIQQWKNCVALFKLGGQSGQPHKIQVYKFCQILQGLRATLDCVPQS